MKLRRGNDELENANDKLKEQIATSIEDVTEEVRFHPVSSEHY